MPSSSRDRWQDVDSVVRADRRLLAAELAVDEHVDVTPDRAALVEDPTGERRMRSLEAAEQLDDSGTLDGMLGAVAGEALERTAQSNHRHRP
jgi:hypothetical protein